MNELDESNEGPRVDSGRLAAAEIAALLFAVVFVLRQVESVPGFGFTLLYDVPVALVAVVFGLRAGVAAATVALGLFAIGDATEPIRSHGIALYTNGIGYVSRAVTFYLLAVLLGWYSHRVRRADGQFRGLLESAPDATVILDESGRVMLANAQAVLLFGYTRDELVELTVDALVPERFTMSPTGHRGGLFDDRGALRIGAPLELTMARKDGREVPVEINLSPVPAERGMLVSAAIRDLTARKREEAIKAQLAAIVESSDDAVLSKTLDGTITSWNAGAERMYGYTAEEAVGRNVSFLCPPGHENDVPAILARLIRTDRIGHFESVRQRKDRSVIDVSLTVSPVVDASGRLVGASTIARNVTDRKRAEEDFRLRTLLESAQDAIVIVSSDGRILRVNQQTEELFGYEHHELPGQLVEVLMAERFRVPHPGHRDAYFAAPESRPMGADLKLYAQRKDGTEFPAEVRLSPLQTPDGTLVSAAIRDVTERKLVENALLEAEERFRRAFDESLVGMAMLDPGRRFVRVNDAACEITGYSRKQLEATSLGAISHPDDLGQQEREIGHMLAGETTGYRSQSRLVHAGQHSLWVAMQTTLLRDSEDQPLRFLLQIQDITDQRRYEARLRHLADHDALTGLLNRRSFERELEAHSARMKRYGGAGAAIVLDLDHFKVINDTTGHGAGDEAITRAATVLRSRLRETDVLARLGGDEFAMLLPGADAPQALLVAEGLLEALRAETVDLGRHGRPLSASAGIALFESEPEPGGEDVLMNADLAMYDAKEAGRDRVSLYAANEHGSSRMKGRMTWAQRIGGALQHDGFTLLAQPIVDLSTGATRQYELLLRMRDEHGDLIPPGAFLYTAERLGMIQEIDRWVTRQAIRLIAEWRTHGEELTLEVNLSGLSIGDPELLALIGSELERAEVPAHSLIFEITETAAVTNMPRAAQFARDLTRLGCRFALDDFGAGYGSFYYLKHLPFDYLKIDGEFVKGCRTNEIDRLLIKAAVDIATGTGKQTIAEYVGDEQTASLLARLGVDHGQGFYHGRPGPLQEPRVKNQATLAGIRNLTSKNH